MKCPFVYANGHRCTGEVYRARAYGKHDRFHRVAVQDIRKFRLWCSEKEDHGGAVPSITAKERMEYYSDDLARLGLYEGVMEMCENVLRGEEQVAQ